MGEAGRTSGIRGRGLRMAAVVAMVTVGLVTLAAPSASASDTGSISGTVVDVGGAPLAGISVRLSGSFSNPVTTTAADGSYTFAGLAADSYKIVFQDDTNHYSQEWWDDQATYTTATSVALADGQVVTGIDATLSVTTISGVVTNGSGQGVEGVQVYAYGLASNAFAWTAADGSYSMTGLVADSYRLLFLDPYNRYTNEWWNDQNTPATATSIAMSRGDTVGGVDAVLSVTTISGVVTDESGHGLAGIQVTASGGSGYDATTRADGSYSITGMVTGSYQVVFKDPMHHYSPEAWNDQPFRGPGTSISIARGGTVTGIDAVLSVTTISGVVTNESGQGLAGIEIEASGTSSFSNSFATTAADGSYALSGLVTDAYTIEFRDPTDHYTFEVWNDQETYAGAATIPVVLGGTTTGIDVTLSVTTISGVVRNFQGQRLAGIRVSAVSPRGTARARARGPGPTVPTRSVASTPTRTRSCSRTMSPVRSSGGTVSPTLPPRT